MDQDQNILDHLKERGSDLTVPHEIEFYVYFPTEETAQKATPEITKEGFRVQILADPSANRWLCLALKEFVPELTAIKAAMQKFDALARPFGGNCDGWGTQVEK